MIVSPMEIFVFMAAGTFTFGALVHEGSHPSDKVRWLTMVALLVGTIVPFARVMALLF